MVKKLFIFTFTAIFCLAVLNPIFIQPVAAEEDGGNILFKDTKKLRHVLFSHQKHKKAENKCEDCHPKIFKKERGSSDKGNAITMKVLRKGQFCGQCHNGKKAFKVMSKCKKCHSVAKT